MLYLGNSIGQLRGHDKGAVEVAAAREAREGRDRVVDIDSATASGLGL